VENVLSFLLGVIGAIPVFLGLYQLVSRTTKARRAIGFRHRGRIDIVLTTAGCEMKSDGGKAAVVRCLSPEGDVLAIAAATAVFGRSYRGKKIITHVSDKVRGPLNDDLLILGSTAANKHSVSYLESSELARTRNLLIDVGACSVGLDRHNGGRLNVTSFDIERTSDGLPRKDVVYICVGPNPYNRRRRAIVCAGYTTYGTGAAAQIFFGQILSEEKSEYRRIRRLVRRCEVIMVLECGLELGQLIHWRILALEHGEPAPLLSRHEEY
jgi:hypothetical protein